MPDSRLPRKEVFVNEFTPSKQKSTNHLRALLMKNPTYAQGKERPVIQKDLYDEQIIEPTVEIPRRLLR